MKRLFARRGVVAIAATGVVLLASGIAYATIPDANGVIHGCYQKSGGALRVLDGLDEPFGTCRLNVNGTDQANSSTFFQLKSGQGSVTLVSAATVSGGGSTIEVDCNTTDSTTVAGVNLSLAKVDNLN